jgi:hypothetical protein
VTRLVLVRWNRDVEPLAQRLSVAGYEVEQLSPQGVPRLRFARRR